MGIIRSTVDAPKRFFVNNRGVRRLAYPRLVILPALITCYPRSGSRYTAKLLQAMGVDMPHEMIGEHGTVSWEFASDAEYKTECDLIIHQTRDPLKTISSAVFHLSPMGFVFMFDTVGKPHGISNDPKDWTFPDRVRIVMHTYYHWNKLIETKAMYRYKVEDIETHIFYILDLIDPDWIGREYKQIDEYGIPKNENTKGHDDLTWADLAARDSVMTSKIQLMAKSYGY